MLNQRVLVSHFGCGKDSHRSPPACLVVLAVCDHLLQAGRPLLLLASMRWIATEWQWVSMLWDCAVD